MKQTFPGRQDAYLLDYARAIFMTSVAVVHLEAIVALRLDEEVWLGLEVFRGTGYQFFFVLTGFLGYRAAVRLRSEEAPVWRFSLRRFARLVPLLWLIVIGNAAAQAVLHGRMPDMPTLLASLVPVPSALEPDPVIVWTLRHVLLFYLLLALWLWRPAAGLVVGAVWLSGCVAALALAAAGGALPFPHSALFNSFSLQFFLGLGAAYVAARRKAPVSARNVLLTLSLVGAVVATGYILGNGREHLLDYVSRNAIIWPVVYGTVFALMIGSLSRFKPVRPPSGLVLAVAAASYAIYLSHAPVMGAIAILAERSGLALPADVFALVALAVAIAVGVLLHRWFEVPVARFIEARARRSPALPVSG